MFQIEYMVVEQETTLFQEYQQHIYWKLHVWDSLPISIYQKLMWSIVFHNTTNYIKLNQNLLI